MSCYVAFILVCVTQMSMTLGVPKIILNDGHQMPAIALGTYLGFDRNGIIKPKGDELRDVIKSAIDVGWRHFDTAAIYGTEESVGAAIRDKIEGGNITRGDIFVTTKLWNTDHKREQVQKALKESLQRLGLGYADLYLIHWPMGFHQNYTYSDTDYMATWRGMEDVQAMGLARSIGLSNFNREQIARVIREGTVKPAVLQIEVHPQIVQSELVAYAQAQGITVMGYSPFGPLVDRFGLRLPGPKFDDPVLVELATKYGKTAAQVVLRWMVDRNIVPVPKTVKASRLQENINIFDFELDKDELRKINGFDSNTRYTVPSFWQDHPFYPFERVVHTVPVNPFGGN